MEIMDNEELPIPLSCTLESLIPGTLQQELQSPSHSHASQIL